jgi:hypothetical protein
MVDDDRDSRQAAQAVELGDPPGVKAVTSDRFLMLDITLICFISFI